MIRPFLSKIDATLTALADAGHWVQMTCLALLTVLMMLPGFAALPALDRDEARYSQATKQMVQSGDYIDIRLGDQPRYKKPVGIYWLQSIPVRILGHKYQREVWVYRTVSLASAVAVSLLTYLVTLSLVGPRAALFAGVLMAVSLVMAAEARQAKTDAALLAAILLAQWGLAKLWVGGAVAMRRFWPWLFWIGLAASTLIKGPIGIMVVGSTMAALCAIRRDARWLTPLRFGPGLLLFALIVVPWYALITLKAGGAFWAESLGRDMLGKVATGQESHGAPPGYYLALVWLTFWPAALLLPYGFAYAWRERHSPAVQFCLAWILPSWIIFEAVATKLPHYTSPTYPALALLTAGGWLARPKPQPGWPHAVLIVILLALGVLLTAAPLGAGLYIDMGPSLIWVFGAVVMGLGIWMSWSALRAGLNMAPLVGMVVMAMGLAFAFWGHLSQIDYLWPARALAKIEAEQSMCDTAVLVSAGYHEPSLQFSSRLLPVLTEGAIAASKAEAADCALVYVEARERDAFLNALTVPADPIAKVEGMNVGTGREMEIEVYRFN